ncbi:DUF1127 domain-containing protein [Maritalea mobilis]
MKNGDVAMLARRGILGSFNWLFRYVRAARLKFELDRKSDRQLADIGLRREEINHISKSWIKE